MKELRKALNKGYFHTNSKEYSKSATENFASTIYTDELSNYLFTHEKKSRTYKYGLKKES